MTYKQAGNAANAGGASSQRNTLYDWIRLFGTVWVVIGHSAYLYSRTTYGLMSYELPIVLSPLYDSPFFTGFVDLSL